MLIWKNHYSDNMTKLMQEIWIQENDKFDTKHKRYEVILVGKEKHNEAQNK